MYSDSSLFDQRAKMSTTRILRYSICLLLPLAVRPKIICRTQFVHLHISESTPGPSGTQRWTTPGTSQSQPVPQKRSSGAATAVIVKNLAVCLPHTPSEICPNIHFVFFLQLAATRKGNAKPSPILTARRRPLQTATP